MNSSIIDPSTHNALLKALFAWYREYGRHDMAWRKTSDPYAIMVSEFMLQQTTVSTVKPYYDRFLKFFPDLKSLGESDLDDVLALWSGLGYYARARNLWAAAKMVLEKFGGKIPADQKTLQSLPGVGYYTSGAISSLAFDRPAVVLDGNIIRVFMRLLAMEEDPKLKAVQVILRKLSFDLSEMASRQSGGSRDMVLALMDLGATVCTPRSPECGVCPISEFCFAKQYGKQDSIPTREEQEDRPTVRLLSAVIQSSECWLLGQRPKKGLFGGLWEFPSLEVDAGVDPIPSLEQWVSDQIGVLVRVEKALPTFEHQLTHRLIVNRPYACVFGSKKQPKLPKPTEHYIRWAWVPPSEVGRYGISSLTKRILSLKF